MVSESESSVAEVSVFYCISIIRVDVNVLKVMFSKFHFFNVGPKRTELLKTIKWLQK